MLAFAGMIMAGQVTGKGPLANLGEHLASPMTTNMFAKAIVSPAGGAQLHCAIPAITSFQGLEIRAFPPSPPACARFPLLALASRLVLTRFFFVGQRRPVFSKRSGREELHTSTVPHRPRLLSLCRYINTHSDCILDSTLDSPVRLKYLYVHPSRQPSPRLRTALGRPRPERFWSRSRKVR